jgi:CRP-like cAMP-binding protein
VFYVTLSLFSTTDASALDRETFVEHDLSADDWQQLAEGARQSVFPPGQSIVVGPNTNIVHQIVSGTVRMVARDGVVVGTLGEGDFIGEVEFVNPSNASGISYVSEGSVETIGFAPDMLRVLFVSKPDLCGRFYRFLCVSLAVRIRELSSILDADAERASMLLQNQ